MINTIAWMLSRMVALRFIGILIGITIFVLSVELLVNAKELQLLQPDDPGIILKYMLFRAPAVLANYLVISILLAMLLSIVELSYRNEMSAIWAAGVSPTRIVIMLMPLALAIGGLQFLLSNSAIPLTTPQLRDWGIGDYGSEKLKVGGKGAIWMRAGPDILRAGKANPQSTELDNLIIFRRDPNGLLREQVYAERASLSGARWILQNVMVYYRDNLEPSHLPTLIYSGDLRPARAGVRSGAPEDMSLNELNYFIENQGFGIRPVWVYETWANKRISLLLSGLLMVGLSIPLATRFRRGGGLGVMFAAGVGLGFAFFIVDGISLTMGEMGFVAPWLAAWFPVAAFGALATALTLRAERL